MGAIKKVFNQKITDYFIQAFFIFLSVFLAFWLNRYQAIYQETYMTTRAELAILQEMKNNLNDLEILNENRIPLVMGKKETLDQLGTYKYFGLNKLIGHEKGIIRSERRLSKSALSLINANNVNIDISRRQQLNKVYEYQQLYTKAESKLFDDFLNSFEIKNPKNTAASYLIFYELLDDIWGKEVSLIHSLKEAIATLEKEY